jgi:hypothetical protein
MSNALIRAAFESRLSAWAQAQTPPILIAYENVPFVQPTGRYLRSYLLPASTISKTLDRLHRQYTGVYQASIVMPLNAGPGDGQVLAAALDALFPIQTPLTQGGIKVILLTPMSAGPAMQDVNNYLIPVSCQYRADTI